MVEQTKERYKATHKVSPWQSDHQQRIERQPNTLKTNKLTENIGKKPITIKRQIK